MPINVSLLRALNILVKIFDQMRRRVPPAEYPLHHLRACACAYVGATREVRAGGRECVLARAALPAGAASPQVRRGDGRNRLPAGEREPKIYLKCANEQPNAALESAGAPRRCGWGSTSGTGCWGTWRRPTRAGSSPSGSMTPRTAASAIRFPGIRSK